MNWLFLLFVALSVSIGAKLGLVFRGRYPQHAQGLIVAAIAQILCLGYIILRIPEMIIPLAFWAFTGFIGAILFDKFVKKKPRKR